MEFKVTFDLLPVVGIVMVFLAYYIPGFKTWFSSLTDEWKQGFMVLVVLAVDAGAVVLSALGVIGVYPADWKQALLLAVPDFFIALAINAGIYKGTNYINDRLSGQSVGKYG